MMVYPYDDAHLLLVLQVDHSQIAQFVCNCYPFNSTQRKNGPTRALSNVPVPTGPCSDNVTLTVDVQDESRAVVWPCPFDEEPLPVSFQGRLLPNRRYDSQEDFLQHFYKAEPFMISYTLHAE